MRFIVLAALTAASLSAADPVWQFTDIGAVARPGTLTGAGADITVTASGADVWGVKDSCGYAWIQLYNRDVAITVQVTGPSASDGWAKAGLMVRDTLAPGSDDAFVALTPRNGAVFERRFWPDRPTETTATGTNTMHWLRIERHGTAITARMSADGTTWKSLGTEAVQALVSHSIYVGCAVTAHHNGLLSSARFTNFVVESLTEPPSDISMHLPLDDGAGSLTADTASGQTYRVIGATWTPGLVGTALAFDGVDDRVALDDPTTFRERDLSYDLGRSATLTAWIRTTQRGNDTMWKAPGITGVEQVGGGDDVFWGWLDAAGRIGIQAGDVPGANGSISIADGVWHHVAMTRDMYTGFVEIWVDGVLSYGASAFSASGWKRTPFSSLGRIESTGGTPKWFRGQLEDVRTYGRVLSGDEIADIMWEVLLRRSRG